MNDKGKIIRCELKLKQIYAERRGLIKAELNNLYEEKRILKKIKYLLEKGDPPMNA